MSNVIVLMSDEHNPFYSSVYGHSKVSTPNMERLASMGTVYENVYCNSPLCTPSRSAFMSGKPVHQLQTYNNCNVIPGNYSSYGRVLRDQGIHTVHIGKTDVWNHSDTLGFSEMHLADNRVAPGDINFRRNPLAVRPNPEKRAEGYGPREDAFERDNMVMDRAMEWLQQTAPVLRQPWTLSINIGAPHFPHYVTQELWDMYEGVEDLPVYGKDCAPANHPYALDHRKHFQTDLISEEQIRGLRRGYLGCVTYVDRQIGLLLDMLERTKLLSDTLFIYASDHGEMLGKFGMWWKCCLYEDSVRIPMIVSGPGFGKGIRVNTPVTLFDLQAALFKAVDRIRPADWWGLPLQDIPANDDNRAIFSEYHGHGTRSGSYMVRKGAWKLIYNMQAPHQLFNLERDPDEQYNLAETKTAVVQDLERELRTFCSPEFENEKAHAYEELQLAAVGKR
jgi:choline-sulfatase